MSEGLSLRIVAFIANLLPLYTHEIIDGRVCARSLVDGTLILPIAEEEEDENGRVELHWQGDASRRSEVLGSQLATLAVARYVELHAVPSSLTTKDGYAHMSQHFSVKTGGALMLEEASPENVVADMLKEASKLLGKEVVAGIVKKTIGL